VAVQDQQRREMAREEVRDMVQSWIQELNSKYRKIKKGGGIHPTEDLSKANDAILQEIAKLDRIMEKRARDAKAARGR
jgi:predicted phage gp36 major capsid-like protein